ncbi:YezD family protein [Paenibacillus hodogayensis]|uniref:YezD family protein n=1 Tax=Paenibacillus hodogayensis TaxID=279208 RepID=A0ABV5VWN3_9BACL
MSNPVQLDDVWADRILNSVNGLEYGSVQIIVHDGKVVQIERTERRRFDSHSNNNQSRIQREPLKQQIR